MIFCTVLDGNDSYLLEEDENEDKYTRDTAVAFHPDEVDFEENIACVINDEDDEEEEGKDENEELQENAEVRRLREINANDSDNDSDDSNDSYNGDDEVHAADHTNNESELIDPILWSWDMTPKNRSNVTAAFLHRMSSVVDVLRQATDEHVAEARRLHADAGCEAFRRARVVAATVVGASRRLEAIRAAEPFAGDENKLYCI